MPAGLSTPLLEGTGLDLKAIWLNAAADLTDVMAFGYAGDLFNITPTGQAEARRLANRVRLVRTGTKKYRPISLTLLRVSPVQQVWLEDHASVLVCVRDPRDPIGTKVYAFYNAASMAISTLPTDEHGNADVAGDLYADVQIALEPIDHSESV